MSRPSLRRPEPERRRPVILTVVLPIVAALALVAVLGGVALAVFGGDEPTEPTGSTPATDPVASPVASASPTASTSYLPPANALPVEHGVHVVPAEGWSVFTPEKQGLQLISTGPNGRRAWFWVRQRKEAMTAEVFAVRIFEGETQGGSQTKASATQRMSCPKAQLVECVSISYSFVLPASRGGFPMRCEVQSFRRTDRVLTAMDFCSPPEFYDKAWADARVMLRSVVDSL